MSSVSFVAVVTCSSLSTSTSFFQDWPGTILVTFGPVNAFSYDKVPDIKRISINRSNIKTCFGLLIILSAVDPFKTLVTFIENVLVTLIENCYIFSHSHQKLLQNGCFELITIKPGYCSKLEFCTNGGKRYLTGGQYIKIAAFWQPLAIKKSGFTVILLKTAIM